jgi:hypothetical protein
LDGAKVHERKPPIDCRTIRNGIVLIVIELPDLREHAERDVELAVGALAAEARRAQHFERLAVDGHRLPACCLVELHDVAAGLPHAEQ